MNAKTATKEKKVMIKSFSVSQSWSDETQYSWSVTLTNEFKEEFKFKLDDASTRMLMVAVASRVSECADDFAQRIRNLAE